MPRFAEFAFSLVEMSSNVILWIGLFKSATRNPVYPTGLPPKRFVGCIRGQRASEKESIACCFIFGHRSRSINTLGAAVAFVAGFAHAGEGNQPEFLSVGFQLYVDWRTDSLSRIPTAILSMYSLTVPCRILRSTSQASAPRTPTDQEQPNMNRRDFLAASGASITTALGAGFISAAETAVSKQSSERVTLAMIGVGGRGSGLTKGFLDRPDVAIAYLCDPDPGQTHALSDEVKRSLATSRSA